jgi:hypothetical protein
MELPPDPYRLEERRQALRRRLGGDVPAAQPADDLRARREAVRARLGGEPDRPSGIRPADAAAVGRGDVTADEFYQTVRETGVSAANPDLGRLYGEIARAPRGAERQAATDAYMNARQADAAPREFAALRTALNETVSPAEQLRNMEALGGRVREDARMVSARTTATDRPAPAVRRRRCPDG